MITVAIGDGFFAHPECVGIDDPDTFEDNEEFQIYIGDESEFTFDCCDRCTMWLIPDEEASDYTIACRVYLELQQNRSTFQEMLKMYEASIRGKFFRISEIRETHDDHFGGNMRHRSINRFERRVANAVAIEHYYNMP